MLYWHVVAFLDQAIRVVNVTARANHRLSRTQVIHRVLAPSLEPRGRCIENYLGFLSLLFAFFVILPRTRHIEFQTVPIQRLIKIKPIWSAVKANLLPIGLLEVTSTCFLRPVGLAWWLISQARDLLFNAEILLFSHHTFVVFSLRHKFFTWNAFWC